VSDQTTPGSAGPETKRCPICAEQVKAAALICRFCGHDFRQAPAPPDPAAASPTEMQQWGAWAPGAAASAQAPYQAPAVGAPGAQQSADWGQWGSAQGVQTYGSLPAPANVPGPSYPVRSTGHANGYAIASMVLGILWVYWIGSILALVFGYIAKGQIDRSGGMETGRGMAIAGIVISIVGLLLTVIVRVAFRTLFTGLYPGFIQNILQSRGY